MTTKENQLEQLINLLEHTRDDYAKFFERGNNAAGTRVRMALQEAKALAQDLRVNIQETKTTQ